MCGIFCVIKRKGKINLEKCNKTVIISGHSNTIPNLIRLFGIDDELKIEDDQYGDLYKIEWSSKSPILTVTHIGV
mgnify:CR=1 FL=1